MGVQERLQESFTHLDMLVKDRKLLEDTEAKPNNVLEVCRASQVPLAELFNEIPIMKYPGIFIQYSA